MAKSRLVLLGYLKLIEYEEDIDNIPSLIIDLILEKINLIIK